MDVAIVQGIFGVHDEVWRFFGFGWFVIDAVVFDGFCWCLRIGWFSLELVGFLGDTGVFQGRSINYAYVSTSRGG